MAIAYKTRQFYPDEQKLLRTLKNRKQNEQITTIKYYHYLIAGAIAAGSIYLITIIKIGFLEFIFGSIAVLTGGFIIFTPNEIYKLKKKHQTFMLELDRFIGTNTVDTCLIKAKRIAMAAEYEDEGDLFIIEIDTDEVLFLWDYDYNLKKKFPCFEFEIYEDRFFKLLGRSIYPLSERITPMAIDKKAKWAYMEHIGAPEHLEVGSTSFDMVIDSMNTYEPPGAL